MGGLVLQEPAEAGLSWVGPHSQRSSLRLSPPLTLTLTPPLALNQHLPWTLRLAQSLGLNQPRTLSQTLLASPAFVGCPWSPWQAWGQS